MTIFQNYEKRSRSKVANSLKTKKVPLKLVGCQNAGELKYDSRL